MNNNKLLEQYAKGLASEGNTRTIFLRFARDFLEYAEGDFNKEKVNRYLDHLRKKHKYSDGTINFVFRIVRTLFQRNGLEWPFRRGEAPAIREDNIQAPALHPNVIGRIIEAVKNSEEPDEAAFVALSTTYGLRRVEMVNLRQSDVRIRDRTIHIATAKHGRERTHLIPPEIIPYLERYDFDQQVSEFGLFVLWHRIEYKIGLNHTDQVGWHSLRRTLNTLLLRRLTEATVMSFLRWKQRTSSHMPFRYSAIRFVGEEGVTTEVIGEALDVDNEVFQVHPFLEYWR